MTIFSHRSLVDAIAAGIKTGGVGGVVRLPRGTFEVRETIYIDTVRGLQIIGEGMKTTDLKWVGEPLGDVIVWNRSSECKMSELSITAGSSIGVAVTFQHGPEGSGPMVGSTSLQSSHNTLERILLSGGDNMDLGVRVKLYDYDGSQGIGDIRNDHHRFYDCRISGYRFAAYLLEGRNAKDLKITDSFTQGMGGPDYGSMYTVCTVSRSLEAWRAGDPDLEIFNQGGAFEFTGQASASDGPNMSGNLGANFRIGDRNDDIVINKAYSEKSARHLLVEDYGSGSSGFCSVTLNSNKFNAGSNFAEDGEVVQWFNAPGPLNIWGGTYGRPKPGLQMRFRHEGSCAFNMEGISLANAGDGQVFPVNAPTNPGYETMNNGYDADGVLGLLGSGVVVETDGPDDWLVPGSTAQWNQIDGMPDLDWLWTMQGDGIVTAEIPADPGDEDDPPTDAVPAVEGVRDTSQVTPLRPLHETGSVTYQQTRPGWDGYFTHLAAVAPTGLTTNKQTPGDIEVESFGILWCGELVATAANDFFLNLGNANTGAGNGGIVLRAEADGQMHLRVNGVSSASTTADYRGKKIYLGFVWNFTDDRVDLWIRSNAGDVEHLESLAPAVVTNSGAKGWGTTGGSAVPPDSYCRWMGGLVGANAEAINADLLAVLAP